jgi:UDP-glucose 4-epimerase
MPMTPTAHAYTRTKAGAETAIRTIARASGLRFAISRPGMIYGPGGAIWAKGLYAIARRSPLIWLGDGSGSTHPIYVDDVVDHLITLALHPAAEGEAFHCTPDPAPTWRAWLGAYARLAGASGWLGLPAAPAYALGALAQLLSPPGSIGRDAPDLIRHLVLGRLTYSMDKSRALLGWTPRVALDEGVARCAAYLRGTAT